MANIRLAHVTKRFGSTLAVNDLSLEINDKEFLVLLGPSGCGKTTTLRMIAGLERLDEGEVWIDAKKVNDLRASERDIAFVFQLYALYPHLTVYENIAFPLKAQGEARQVIHERVIQVAELLKIKEILKKKPKSLSGGDMQRVALGRAIVRRPKAFLMDEPIGTLDAHFREKTRNDLRRLHLDLGATTVYVTHDQVEAMSMADRIAVMNLGKLQQVGSPIEVYDSPNTLFVANFLGSPGMNFADCRLVSDAEKRPVIRFLASDAVVPVPERFRARIDGRIRPDSACVFGIRPRDIEASHERSEGAMAGEVYLVERLGSHNIIDVKLREVIFRVKCDASFAPGVSSAVWLHFNPDRIHLFDKKSEMAIF
jgi:multiple sugar transport system ATP-binding protein